MKIAFLGSRGVPARIGGFERYVEEIGQRLAGLGHDIWIYCEYANSSKPRPQEHKGMKLIHLPHLKMKGLEALSFDFISLIHSTFQKFDILYVLGYGGSYFCLFPKIFGNIIVINTDGLEWKRSKWNWIGKFALKMGQDFSVWVADYLISDSKAIQRYYEEEYKTKSEYLTYGGDIYYPENPQILKEYNLKPGEYFTVVCRIEPENNVELIINEFLQTETDKQLVILGGANYKSQFVQRLMQIHDKRLRFLGVISDKPTLMEIRAQSCGYLHGHEVGGTNPSLVEALGCGNMIFALNVPYNAEVIEEAGVLFDKTPGDLRAKLQYYLAHPERAHGYGEKARARVHTIYNWDLIAEQHAAFFHRILKEQGRL